MVHMLVTSQHSSQMAFHDKAVFSYSPAIGCVYVLVLVRRLIARLKSELCELGKVGLRQTSSGAVRGSVFSVFLDQEAFAAYQALNGYLVRSPLRLACCAAIEEVSGQPSLVDISAGLARAEYRRMEACTEWTAVSTMKLGRWSVK